jgi:hypothetical protein
MWDVISVPRQCHMPLTIDQLFHHWAELYKIVLPGVPRSFWLCVNPCSNHLEMYLNPIVATCPLNLSKSNHLVIGSANISIDEINSTFILLQKKSHFLDGFFARQFWKPSRIIVLQMILIKPSVYFNFQTILL